MYLDAIEIREIVGLGDLVFYAQPGYAFEGDVIAIDEGSDRLLLAHDERGERREHWVGMERCQHVLCAAAR